MSLPDSSLSILTFDGQHIWTQQTAPIVETVHRAHPYNELDTPDRGAT